jgi:hypothetical protein
MRTKIRLVILAAAALSAGCAALENSYILRPSQGATSRPATIEDVRNELRQQCIRQQIMRHGAGGPAPNFAGC